MQITIRGMQVTDLPEQLRPYHKSAIGDLVGTIRGCGWEMRRKGLKPAPAHKGILRGSQNLGPHL